MCTNRFYPINFQSFSRLEHIFFILPFLFAFFQSCGHFIHTRHKAVNHKKLNQVYIIEDDVETKIFKTKEAWLEYCNSRNPWGTNQLRKGNQPFTGKVVRVYRKSFFSKPKFYGVFNYVNGYIDGDYYYVNNITGKKIIEGKAAVDFTEKNKGSNKSGLCELTGSSLFRFELAGNTRREYVLSEKANLRENEFYWFVRDSLCMHIKKTKNRDGKLCIETSINQADLILELRVSLEGDTLYFKRHTSSGLLVLNKESWNELKPYYKYPHWDYLTIYHHNTPDHKPLRSFYEKVFQDDWSALQGYRRLTTDSFSLTTTLNGDTLEFVSMRENKKHGDMIRKLSSGQVVEKISFHEDELHGVWVGFNQKGDTVFLRSYINGIKHGIWKNDLEEKYYENGELNGLVRIFRYDNVTLFSKEYAKFLFEEYYVKDGRKHGVCKIYYTQNQRNEYGNGLHREENYFNGMLMGEVRRYKSDGKLEHIDNYDYDKRHGCQIFLRYENGEISRVIKSYYEHGKLIEGMEEKCNYKAGD